MARILSIANDIDTRPSSETILKCRAHNAVRKNAGAMKRHSATTSSRPHTVRFLLERREVPTL
jgi:hypothetical protein